MYKLGALKVFIFALMMLSGCSTFQVPRDNCCCPNPADPCEKVMPVIITNTLDISEEMPVR